jgi:endopeptidase La
VVGFLNTEFRNNNKTAFSGKKLVRQVMELLAGHNGESMLRNDESLPVFLDNIVHAQLGFRDEATRERIVNGLQQFFQLLGQKSDVIPVKSDEPPTDGNGELPANVFAADQNTQNTPPLLALPAPVLTLEQKAKQLEFIVPPVDFNKNKSDNILKVHSFSPDVIAKVQERLTLSRRKEGSDSTKAKNWLDKMLYLPWKTETRDRTDTALAREIFRANFYGMDRLEARIAEEIAVRKLQGGNQGGILLFVGPPGTGKTAVARTVAQMLGRKFVLRSLAGISDAQKLIGHDYTYIGSKPGLIIDAMIEAGSRNPVFQIDEIDKVGQGGVHGNPLDALLPVLDPQQNHLFTDSYLEVPFDLSKVLFICTANRIEDFPAPLLSRTEIFRFDPYLPEQKVEIAATHMVPKQHAAYNLPPERLTFTREGLAHLIEQYTAEAGVRKLEETIRSLFRKASLHLDQHPEETQLVVTPERIDGWLEAGGRLKRVTPGERKVGAVNGMYYTEIGGGILPVQVSIAPGRGTLTMTGSLGEVMQEAAKVALSQIVSARGRLGLDPQLEELLTKEQYNIHIHYPDGAVRKDGPSAGSATFLALWSRLANVPVPTELALTGEIDLEGNVTAIGGLMEKISGAAAQGIHTIYLSEENRKDLKDLCQRSPMFQKMVDRLTIRFVKNTEDVVRQLRQDVASGHFGQRTEIQPVRHRWTSWIPFWPKG